jgi:ketosteroid isomerase-like protein
MSAENLETVGRWTESYNSRDIEGVLEVVDPDIEFRSIFVEVSSQFRGHEGLRTYFRELDEAYDDFRVMTSEVFDAGAGVLVSATAHWRGKASGVEGRTPLYVAYWLRAGKIFRLEVFIERAEAFASVGLADQAARS